MKSYSAILLMLLPVLSTQLVAEEIRFGDKTRGQQLHQKHCTSCHNSDVYTRENRKINSYDSLIHRVGICASQLDIKIDAAQQHDIAQYLAESFYRFRD
ncbi:MAG: cytochrome c [Gammaproteobacteria bacterium]|nr:cytochrome c [Gammaproteobacteria bacterium]